MNKLFQKECIQICPLYRDNRFLLNWHLSSDSLCQPLQNGSEWVCLSFGNLAWRYLRNRHKEIEQRRQFERVITLYISTKDAGLNNKYLIVIVTIIIIIMNRSLSFSQEKLCCSDCWLGGFFLLNRPRFRILKRKINNMLVCLFFSTKSFRFHYLIEV